MSNQNRHGLPRITGLERQIGTWVVPYSRFTYAIRSVIRGGFGVDVGFSERTRC